MSSNDMKGTPGANAMGDPFEFMKNLWSSVKLPGMSMPGMAMPSMSPEEVDKQIADLKAVESWLQVNMNMLRGSIQALEVQSATLSALRSMSQSFAQASAPRSEAGASPATESPFCAAAQGSANDAYSSHSGSDKASSDNTPGNRASSHGASESASSVPDPAAVAAQFANPALWWNVVQDQFSQAVNQATQSSKPKKAKPSKQSTQPRQARPKSASKTTAAKSSTAASTARRKRAPKT